MLNWLQTGDKAEHNENYNVKNKDEHLNYDSVIGFLGKDIIGEVDKGILQSAAVIVNALASESTQEENEQIVRNVTELFAIVGAGSLRERYFLFYES